MKRAFGLTLLGFVLALSTSVSADGALAGNWRLATMSAMGDKESNTWLVKFETKDGKTTATLVGSVGKDKAQLVSFAINGDRVRIVVKAATEQVFEGLLNKEGNKIAGVLGNDLTAAAAYMVPTDKTSIAAKVVTSNLSAKQSELETWANSSCQVAAEYGSPWAAEIPAQFALAFLAARKNVKDSTNDAALVLAADFAGLAQGILDNQAAPEHQVKVLQVVCRVFADAGKHEEQKLVAAQLEKLEKVVDAEYAAKVPSFKVQKFAGRKGPSDRVVVMELFTGAQCPDCPPADVAFEVMEKSYTPRELVLLQYHLHIPGADPLTNADGEARWKHYKAAHGKGVPGTPTSLFNGIPKGGYGGRLPDGEKYYNTYRSIVDPLLETPASCKVTASAKPSGDKIHIAVQVAGLKEPGKDKKLRVALVEETIRFVGSNRIRFHHQVVRSFPGGVAGVAVANPNFSVEHEVDVVELRKQLNNYLDNYALTTRPFPQVVRPMDLQNMRVIAFVQDDVTHEILQATQVDVR